MAGNTGRQRTRGLSGPVPMVSAPKLRTLGGDLTYASSPLGGPALQIL